MTEKTNRIIVVEYPGMGEIADTLLVLDREYRKGRLDCLAINPHEKFRLYLRAALIHPPKEIELEKTGHYAMYLKYLQYRNIAGSFLDVSDFEAHLKNIEMMMRENSCSHLGSIVNAENKDFFSEKFAEKGFKIL